MQEPLTTPEKIPEYTFEDELSKCSFFFYEPGIFLIRAEGELTQESAKFLCDTLPRVQQWLMAQPTLVYFIVDIQCHKATATARNYLLRQLRWKLSGRVVKCYIYFKVPLARALIELLAKINHRTAFESISHWSEGVDRAKQHRQALKEGKLDLTPHDPTNLLPEALKNSELEVYFYQTENNEGQVHFYKPSAHCLYLYFSGRVSRSLIQHVVPICSGLLQDMPLHQEKHELMIDVRHTSRIDKSAVFEAYRQSLTQAPHKSIYFIHTQFSEPHQKRQRRWIYFMITSLFKTVFSISDYDTVIAHLFKKTPLDLAPREQEQETPEEERKRLKKWCIQQEQLLRTERAQHTQEMEHIRNILWMLLLRESRSPLQVSIPRGDSLSSDTLQLLDVFQRDQFQLIEDLQHQIDERTRAEQRAAHANEIKGEFLASMSHEIRTPLNAILGFTNVLKNQKKSTLTPEQNLYLSRIQENGAHLLNLVNNILDLSELESGKLKVKSESIALDVIVNRIVNQLGVLIDNKGLDVKRVLCKRFLETDEQRLQQIIVNLLNNAIKFTDSGSITIRCECKKEKVIALHIEDTGCGISPEAQERIFEAFEQEATSVKKEGSGLGLAICTRLCNHLGYHMGLHSTPERGSIFSLYFHPREPKANAHKRVVEDA